MIRFVPIVALAGGAVLACEPDLTCYSPTPTVAWDYQSEEELADPCVGPGDPYDCCIAENQGCAIDGFRIYWLDCERCSIAVGYNFPVETDSEELAGEDGAASNSVDGDITTIWHTAWTPDPTPDYPHFIEIDFGQVESLCGFSYLPRQDGSTNGTVLDYQVWLSETSGHSLLAASGRFLAEDYTVYFERDFKARWFKFDALSEINGQPFASAAEITPIKADCDLAKDNWQTLGEVPPHMKHVAIQKWDLPQRRFVNLAVKAYRGENESPEYGYIDLPICMPELCEAQTQPEYRACFEEQP